METREVAGFFSSYFPSSMNCIHFCFPECLGFLPFLVQERKASKQVYFCTGLLASAQPQTLMILHLATDSKKGVLSIPPALNP